MKKLMITIMVLVMSVLYAGQTEPPCGVQANKQRGEMPFGYDPNMVSGYLLGYLSTQVGGSVSHEITYCDPDEDVVELTVVDLPAGATAVDEILTWTPSAAGVWYVYLSITDRPQEAEDAKTVLGTILLQGRPINNHPVLLPVAD